MPPEHNSLSVTKAADEPVQKWGPLDEAAQLFAEKNYAGALSRLLSAKNEQEEILGSIENFIAFNYLELDDTESAKSAAERALKLNPFSSQAYATLGEVFSRHKDYASAKKMFEISLQHNPENNFAQNGLQTTCNALGIVGNMKTVNV